jgi:Asp-tRNA(Asn)/Glu-tRNA(Gln) amidotransferase A subunit family amidase
VADAALAYAVMAGGPAHTATPLPLAGARIGVPRNYFFDPLADDVARSVHAALALMRADGAELIEADLPGVENCAAMQFVTLCSEATDLHWQRLNEDPETLGPDVRVRLEIGQFLPATWYVRAQRARAALAVMFEASMRDLDVLVTPTLRIEPPRSGGGAARIGDRDVPLHSAMTALTMPFNLTGMPALTLPCGRGDNGLPIGVQIAGRRGDDWRVLDIGARLEALLNFTP